MKNLLSNIKKTLFDNPPENCKKILLKVRQETATAPEAVERKTISNLLLQQNEQTYHYVLIINFMKLFAKVKGREYRDSNELSELVSCMFISRYTHLPSKSVPVKRFSTHNNVHTRQKQSKTRELCG